MTDTVRKSKKLQYIGGVFIAALIVVAVQLGQPLPACDSSDARSMAMRSFDASNIAFATGLSADYLHSTSVVKESPDGLRRECSGTMDLSNGESMNVTYSMESTDDGGYMLSLSVD